jgi:hypothetical protein
MQAIEAFGSNRYQAKFSVNLAVRLIPFFLSIRIGN